MCRLLGLSLLLGTVVSTSGCASRTATSVPPTSLPVVSAPSVDLPLLERRVAAHMRFLASDALNGRGSGTRDEWIAATYIGAQLAALGLDPMGDDGWFVQQVEVQRFTAATPPVLTVGDRTFTRGTAFLVGQVPGARVAGVLQRVSPGTTAAAGAVVLLPADAPPTAMTGMAAAALVLRRASAAQAGNWAQMARQLPEFISSQLVGTPAAAPAGPTVLTLDAATHDAISAMADGTAIRLDTALVAGDRIRTWNVVGRLPGSDPSASSEVVILSAHLDHLGARAGTASDVADTIYNGADDDASGVVAVLELARVLAAGPTPRRPVVFALFGSEESGGYGARYFVDRPVVPLTDIVADLQVEMIGRPDPKVPAAPCGSRATSVPRWDRNWRRAAPASSRTRTRTSASSNGPTTSASPAVVWSHTPCRATGCTASTTRSPTSSSTSTSRTCAMPLRRWSSRSAGWPRRPRSRPGWRGRGHENAECGMLNAEGTRAKGKG